MQSILFPASAKLRLRFVRIAYFEAVRTQGFNVVEIIEKQIFFLCRHDRETIMDISMFQGAFFSDSVGAEIHMFLKALSNGVVRRVDNAG